MLQVQVLSGDVTKIKSDALITAINSGGAWFGGIDGVIQRVAGDLFHKQAKQAMPLTDGQAVVALRGNSAHRGDFTNIVFVVDDLERPLSQIIYAGLKAAMDAGFSTVTLPTIRMGVMFGAVEKTQGETVEEMFLAVKRFQQNYSISASVKVISFVVYNDPNTEALLRQMFRI